MSTAPVRIQPPYNQQDFFDPATGKLTEWGWWFLQQLQQGAQGAVDNSQLNAIDLTPVGGIVVPDLSLSGPQGSFLLAGGAGIVIETPIFTGGTVPNGSQITVFYDQGNIGGYPAPTFSTTPGGWLSYINSLVIIETVNTRTSYRFGYDGHFWTLLSFQTGEPKS